MRGKFAPGARFGRLTVIGSSPTDPKTHALCQCNCGNIVDVWKSSLCSGRTKSCGCLRSEVSKRTSKKNFARTLEENRRYGTNFGLIDRKAPTSANTSGHTGVKCWNGKYEAYIGISGRNVYIGVFDTFDEAIQARESAEEKYYRPLISARDEARAVSVT